MVWFSLFVQMIPVIGNLIVDAENLYTSWKAGHIKKDYVMGAVTNATKAIQIASPNLLSDKDISQITTATSELVDATVAIHNASGLFTHSSDTSAVLPGVVNG
jgi:hypothetical protein